MAKNPKVFISYSHDSPEHKQWVSELAARLRRDGIDAILDQWDLGLGDDVTRFMERNIVNADRVLVICTDEYVNKANAGEGGVGYERMIVNAELVQNLGTDKFIPIIRQASRKEKTPPFLGTRVYADFRDEKEFDEEFSKLIHALHQVPFVQKPPLGESPFTEILPDKEISSSKELHTRLPDIPEQIKSAADAYKAAVEIIRVEDTFGWRQLMKRIKPGVFNSLVQWGEHEQEQWGEHEQKRQQLENKEPFQVVDEVVKIISPLMAVALAGVESCKKGFRNQNIFLHNLEDTARQNLRGIWVNIPRTLGYVYHSLHGSIGLSTDQLDLALGLARSEISDIYTKSHLFLWERSEFMGWSKSLGGNCIGGWNYLSEAFERWDWLSLIFGNDSEEYRASLVAYYMALNIHELAVIISSNQQNKSGNSYNMNFTSYFNVPLTFMSENQDIYERSTSLLFRNPQSVSELWSCLNVTRDQMENSWINWVRSFEHWLENVYGRYSDVNMRTIYKNVDSHQIFFEMLQP